MRFVFIFIACLTPWTACAAQETGVEQLLAQADPAIQAQFRVALDSPSELVVTQTIDALKAVDREDREDYLVKQFAIAAATMEEAQGEQGICLLLVLGKLDIPPGVFIRVLAPHLESENKGLRDFADEWFDGYTRTQHNGPFDEVADYVRDVLSRNEEVPSVFTLYLFKRSPGRALLAYNQAAEVGNLVAMMIERRTWDEAQREERRKKGEDRIIPYQLLEGATEQEIAEAKVRNRPFTEFQPVQDLPAVLPRQRDKKLKKEILLAEHLVSHAVWLKKYKFDEQLEGPAQEAKEQLTNLSEHDEWWVRLYVAVIMRRHRELRVSEVWEKLGQDRNVHVSELVTGRPHSPSAR
ncbi:hypothetical protein Pla108_05130 [Botrimarina colliarenosi]|uniref:HEAT repeat domain-containing protein n=1 Tax=Botrimarina colliarenosi TaxID=2528001 RepID=A0A5C6AJK5_9BACT|nr:hypothetical protein [Botrimarina colliarenosi]TWT99570.1 hypothetical protein Pla108_05130 [Botrimarina colliarenosi]